MRVILPRSILSHQEIQALRPRDRENYIESIILEILVLNSRGITISQTARETGFSRDTVSKHLDRLLAIREAYKVDRGVGVYYKNGKVADEHDLKLLTSDDKTYMFYKLVNDEGEFIYIQEREIDEFRALKVKGGIMISSKDFKPFLSALQGFAMKGEN